MRPRLRSQVPGLRFQVSGLRSQVMTHEVIVGYSRMRCGRDKSRPYPTPANRRGRNCARQVWSTGGESSMAVAAGSPGRPAPKSTRESLPTPIHRSVGRTTQSGSGVSGGCVRQPWPTGVCNRLVDHSRLHRTGRSVGHHVIATVGGVGGATSTDGNRVGCVCRITAGLNPPTRLMRRTQIPGGSIARPICLRRRETSDDRSSNCWNTYPQRSHLVDKSGDISGETTQNLWTGQVVIDSLWNRMRRGFPSSTTSVILRDASL